jgi:hypothetical protein
MSKKTKLLKIFVFVQDKEAFRSRQQALQKIVKFTEARLV